MNWSDLDLNSKSKLMELYLKNGITSLTAMKEHYNSLQDGGKLTFKQWKEKMQQKYPDIEMDNNKAGYDYETYFNDNYNEAIAQLNNLRHFPDTYKLYNHPTFSNESIYSRGPMIGGSWGYAHPWDTQWSNTEGFTPSIVNRQVHPEIYKEDRPYTEDEIYSHKFDEGGPKKTPNFVSGSTAINPNYKYYEDLADKYPIIAEATSRGHKIMQYKPYLRPDQEFNVRNLFTRQNNTITDAGVKYIEDAATRNITGRSKFMQGIDRMAVIPNLAVTSIGVVPAISGLLASTTNPFVDAALTIHGAVTVPENIKEGIQDIKEGNTWQGIGELGLTALDLTGTGKLIHKGVNVAKSPNRAAAFVDNFITSNQKIDNPIIKNILLNALRRNAGDAHPVLRNITKHPINYLDDLYVTGLFPEKSSLTPISNSHLQREMQLIISPNYSSSLGNKVAHVTEKTPLYQMDLIPSKTPLYKRATSKLQSNNFTGWRPSSTHNSASLGRLNSFSSKDIGGHWERLTKDGDLWTDEIYDLQHFTPTAYEKSWNRGKKLPFLQGVGLEILNRAWTPFSLYGKRTYLKPSNIINDNNIKYTMSDGIMFEEMPSL